MNILSRYSLRQVLLPTLLASVVISVLLLGSSIQQQLGDFQESFPIAQFEFMDLAKIAFYILPTLVGFVVPIAFMIGTLLTFSRLSQWNELTAMKAAGISLKRIMFPVIVAGGCITVGCFIVLNALQPYGYRMLTHLFLTDLPARVTLSALPVGVVHDYGDWRFYAREKDEDGTLHDVSILVQREGQQSATYYAATASVHTGGGRVRLEMENGRILPVTDSSSSARINFDSSYIETKQVLPPDGSTHRKSMTFNELIRSEHSLSEQLSGPHPDTVVRDLRKFQTEIADRLSFPLMCLAVSLIAAPVAVRSPKSGPSLAFAKGVAIIGGYFVLRKALENVWIPSLPATVAIGQTPNVLMALMGMVLIWRADRI